MAINYDIPMLFSGEFIDGLKPLVNLSNDKIKSAYGSARFGILGQARYSQNIPDLSIDDLQKNIKRLHELNIRFHYTLNSPWTDLKERKKEYKSKIIDDMNKLIDAGVDAFIVANPYLIALIREKFPQMDIIGSINFQTITAYKFKNLLDYGCTSVVLDRPANRNITFLKKLEKYNDRFSLLVNSTCLFDCPLQQYHANENGYFSSESKLDNPVEDKNYCTSYCLDLIENKPENILKSTWIRPEDIGKYEKLGVKNFKIQGRTLKPDILLNLIKAYLQRKTPDDNLFFIFPGFIERFPDYQGKFKNSKLNDMKFYDFFFDEKINCATDCLVCNYCETIYKKL